MLLMAHDTEDDAKASAQMLRGMGLRARKLLAECVELQEVHRAKTSQVADQLSNAGFLFIRDLGDKWHSDYLLSPSLTGEEALEMLDTLEHPTE